MKDLNSSIIWIGFAITAQLLLHKTEAGSNILGQGSGFCFKQIPRKSIAQRCSSDDYCRDLVNYPLSYGAKCGTYGECVIQHQPNEELCKDACESSSCGKFCLQSHGTKLAKYCIKTRDHPNALPPTVPEQNQFHCTCIAPDQFLNSRTR